MARRSTLDRLPLPLQAEIGRLRQTHTLDQILAHLQALGGPAAGIKRSSLHRYVAKVDEDLAEDLRRARGVSAFLAQSLDEAPGSAAARLNVELLHDQVFSLLRQAREAQRAAETGGEAEGLDAKSIMALAKSLESLTRASRNDLDFMREAEKRAADKARAEAATAAETTAKAAGMSAELMASIKRSILGVPA